MTPALQDKIGQWIFENQGTGAWEGYDAGRRNPTNIADIVPEGNLLPPSFYTDLADGNFTARTAASASGSYLYPPERYGVAAIRPELPGVTITMRAPLDASKAERCLGAAGDGPIAQFDGDGELRTLHPAIVCLTTERVGVLTQEFY